DQPEVPAEVRRVSRGGSSVADLVRRHPLQMDDSSVSSTEQAPPSGPAPQVNLKPEVVIVAVHPASERPRHRKQILTRRDNGGYFVTDSHGRWKSPPRHAGGPP